MPRGLGLQIQCRGQVDEAPTNVNATGCIKTESGRDYQMQEYGYKRGEKDNFHSFTRYIDIIGSKGICDERICSMRANT